MNDKVKEMYDTYKNITMEQVVDILALELKFVGHLLKLNNNENDKKLMILNDVRRDIDYLPDRDNIVDAIKLEYKIHE